MKKLFDEHFEKTWTCIFLFMFDLIMLPLPIFYSHEYMPSFLGGIPIFIIGWIVHSIITFTLIIIYYKMCMKRKEYHEYE